MACAATICTEDYPLGLNHFDITLTPTEYAALGRIIQDAEGNPVLENGNPQPQPRHPVPVKPERPRGNVGAPQLAFWKADELCHARVAVGTIKLRKEILIAIGQVCRDDLSTGPGGISAQSLSMILRHLELKYGTLTEKDIKHLRGKLSDKFTTPAKFTQEASKFKTVAAALEAGGGHMNQTQLIEIFTEATLAVVGIPSIIARYKRRVAGIPDRLLNDMMEQIENELPLITTSDAMFANATQQLLIPSEVDNWANATTKNDTTTSNMTSSAQLGELLKSVNERLNSMESTLRTAGRGSGGRGAGRAGRGDGRGAGRGGAAGRGAGRGGTTSQERPTVYCFEHGFQRSHTGEDCHRSHTGEDCHRMKTDTTYTQDMKTATGPCTINGYEGSK